MRLSTPHPFPYQGSKRSLAKHILPYIPSNTERLIEPFCGSAAVSIAAAASGVAKRFVINDVNASLMDLWAAILHDPEHLLEGYERVWNAQHTNRKEYFLRIRSQFNQTRKPHHLLYLLARIVKGAVRYSSDGSFNQSADNRRTGMKPANMRQNILGVSRLLSGRTDHTALDFRDVVVNANELDVVYMDPPYQGTSFSRDHRYLRGLTYNELADVLAQLNTRRVSYIVSYDGRTGEKYHGKSLPSDLHLHHMAIYAGKSSQATFLGETQDTVESLYLSPALVNRILDSENPQLWTGRQELESAVHG